MTLSSLSEGFLKFILDNKTPKDFVSIEENELPEEFREQIFGLAKELETANLIINLAKFGKPGHRGINFNILPKGLSYFEEKVKAKAEEKTPQNIIVNYEATVIGSDNVVSGMQLQKIKPPEKEKSWFEKYWFRLILVMIPAIAAIIAAIIEKPPPIPPVTTTATSLSTISSTISPTITPIITSTSTLDILLTDSAAANVCAFANGPLTVGIFDLGPDYSYADIFDRLIHLGLQPSWIQPSSTYNDLKKFDVIYLPTGWAIIDPILEMHPKFLKDYLQENGGGLFVEQPNSEREFSPEFMPFNITYITNKMNLEDWPLSVVNSSNFLTRGLDADDLPGPMDCAEMDSAYVPLVKGSKTGCTSMAIASFGKGRIIISMGNASPTMEKNNLPMISDVALCRMFGWVSHEYE